MPRFAHYVYSTLTGATGVMLVTVLATMHSFALPAVRMGAYRAFWVTHRLYIPFYVLCVLHGLPRLVASPRFLWFFGAPAVIYFFDRLWSLKQRHLVLEVFDSQHLPSDVTYLRFMRPPDFAYKSGQWVRIACDAANAGEYHAFTLTSAPHQPYLSVHVKSLGAWTWKLRQIYDPDSVMDTTDYPPLRVEGPFGGGNQDW